MCTCVGCVNTHKSMTFLWVVCLCVKATTRPLDWTSRSRSGLVVAFDQIPHFNFFLSSVIPWYFCCCCFCCCCCFYLLCKSRPNNKLIEKNKLRIHREKVHFSPQWTLEFINALAIARALKSLEFILVKKLALFFWWINSYYVFYEKMLNLKV